MHCNTGVLNSLARKYECQEKAWMDADKMHWLINVVLKPWKDAHDMNNHGVQPPIIVLDAYRMHQMGQW
jgi:hypothetical protein